MNAVPDEKQGVASAVNDTTREVGAAVGIAVAGSVLAAQYNNALAPGLAAFPEQVRSAALESLANALAVAEHMGPQGAGIARLAVDRAFSTRWTYRSWSSRSLLLIAAAFVAIWAPGRDGQQLAVIQRLTSRASV